MLNNERSFFTLLGLKDTAENPTGGLSKMCISCKNIYVPL